MPGLSIGSHAEAPASTERGKLTLPWSLLLLGSGYFLLVAGPLLTSRFAALRWARDLVSGRAWLPAPAAAGTALLGAAALIYVVARLVRDVEQRPYASIAPVLAVFSGFVLTSTRTELPLPGIGAAQLGIIVLALALLGGVLICRNSGGERALGWFLSVLPSLAVTSVVTAALGHADPISMLRSVDPTMRTYLMLLGVSSLSLALVGAVARNLVPRAAASEPANSRTSQLDAFREPVLRLPRPQPAAAHPRSQPELRASPPDLRASAHSRGRAGEA
ncbi:MAG: hypothetical protein JWN48_3731, partial [Myxococcaceae bacterium]|nr:hypothetical protein [Myxococcaceae bacterium]